MSKELTILEKLELLIPGFKGYKQRELIREDDALVRRKVASILDDARLRVERLISSVKRRDITLALRLDDLRLELMKVAQMIRHATYGYAGLFDRVHIDEPELMRLLEMDYRLITQASAILEKVYEMNPTMEPQEFREKLEETFTLLNRLEDNIRLRERMFKTEEVSEGWKSYQ
ncbi:MAG: hypothetical protein DRJ35_00415 [Thermoprotei archaeon]|nr:MAG: hypothetical protein DRJ35_00415 [Thermoprotei archaeon]